MVGRNNEADAPFCLGKERECTVEYRASIGLCRFDTTALGICFGKITQSINRHFHGKWSMFVLWRWASISLMTVGDGWG